MQSGLDKEREYRLLAECLTCFKTVKTFNQHEPLAVFTDQNGCCLATLQYALRDLLVVGRYLWVCSPVELQVRPSPCTTTDCSLAVLAH